MKWWPRTSLSSVGGRAETSVRLVTYPTTRTGTIPPEDLSPDGQVATGISTACYL
jgi:hypothetical protein